MERPHRKRWGHFSAKMIHKTNYFDGVIASIFNGTKPEAPAAGPTCLIKGHSMRIENELSQSAKAMRVLESLNKESVRFLHIDAPARRVQGALCLVPLLIHHRLVDVFCIEDAEGFVVVALFCNDSVAAYRLADGCWNVNTAG